MAKSIKIAPATLCIRVIIMCVCMRCIYMRVFSGVHMCIMSHSRRRRWLCIRVCICVSLTTHVHMCVHMCITHDTCAYVCAYAYHSRHMCICVCMCITHDAGADSAAACDSHRLGEIDTVVGENLLMQKCVWVYMCVCMYATNVWVYVCIVYVNTCVCVSLYIYIYIVIIHAAQIIPWNSRVYPLASVFLLTFAAAMYHVDTHTHTHTRSIHICCCHASRRHTHTHTQTHAVFTFAAAMYHVDTNTHTHTQYSHTRITFFRSSGLLYLLPPSTTSPQGTQADPAMCPDSMGRGSGASPRNRGFGRASISCRSLASMLRSTCRKSMCVCVRARACVLAQSEPWLRPCIDPLPLFRLDVALYLEQVNAYVCVCVCARAFLAQSDFCVVGKYHRHSFWTATCVHTYALHIH